MAAPTIGGSSVGSIGNTTAVATGSVSSLGGKAVTERGVVWSTSPNPTTADNKNSHASALGYGVHASPVVDEALTATPSIGTLVGNATMVVGSYLRLTQALNNEMGRWELPDDQFTDLEVDFEFWSGSNPGGADAVYFYVNNTSAPGQEDSNTGGYIFYYSEYNDVIAVRWQGTILTSVANTTLDNSTWRAAKIILNGTTLKMFLDGVEIFSYTDTARTFTGSKWGFGGRTGGLNNEHRIRNVKVSEYTASQTVNITGLSPATSYNARYFATNADGTTYGSNLPFTTLSEIEPVFADERVYDVGRISAFADADVTAGSGITQRGFVLSQSPYPTISDTVYEHPGTTGDMTMEFLGVEPGKKYYTRPFATNSLGTFYGKQLSFITLIDLLYPEDTQESLWKFIICDASGNQIANLLNVRSRRVAIGLNKAGEASFSTDMKYLYDLGLKINHTPKSLLGVGRHVLKCYRGDTLYFAGQITQAVIDLDDKDARVDVKALGWFWLLSKRYVALDSDWVYNDSDAGAIAWDVIDSVQSELNGDFGIVQGSIPASVNRDLTLKRQNVAELIEELADSENGFDFDINPDKVFTVYYPAKGTDKSSTVRLQYPGKNIRYLQERYDAAELANSITAFGSGTGLAEINATRDNITSQEIFVKQQKLVPVKNLDNATVIGDIAQQNLDRDSYIVPVFKIGIYGNDNSPSVLDFTTGDMIMLIVKKPYYTINQAFRVFDIAISIQENDLELVDLVVGLI